MNIENTIQQFRLLWGEAPQGSLKYKKGKEIEVFLKNALEEQKTAIINDISIKVMSVFIFYEEGSKQP